jgi:uncharacterized protein (DUF58 family)
MAQLDTARLWAEAAAAADHHDGWPRQLRTALTTLGQHPRGQAGSGADFWQYRSLTQGESAARIDWRKSARSDALLVRDHERDVPTRVHIWCDLSGSMQYRSGKLGQSKAAWAYACAAAMAIVAQGAGENVSLIGGSGIQRGLDAVRVHLGTTTSPPEPTVLPTRSLIIIVSDCLGLTEWVIKIAAATLPLQSRIIVIQVFDPAEAAFPFDGRVEFQGLESEALQEVDDAARARPAYLLAWSEFQAHLKKTLQDTQNTYISQSTDTPLTEAVTAIIAQLRPV